MTQVIVVGAGPSGLMLALTLAARGVRVSVIEKRAERSTESRALVVQARTLELFDKLGIVDAFLKAGKQGIGLELFARGQRRASVDFSEIGAEDTRFRYVFFLSQAATEKILEEALATYGVSVERGVELVSFRASENSVEVKTQTDVRTARFLVGCDGAHSGVRRGLGLTFDGDKYSQDFLLADVQVEWSLNSDKLLMFLERAGLVAHFPLSKNVSRLVIGRRGTRSDDGTSISLEEMQAAAQSIVPVPVKLSRPLWLARFRLHHRGVKKYRVGSAFLVGDAAHIHSPAGGQGMNTGIQDAMNLGWKLAQALKTPSEGLLDSYHEERWPVGQRLLATTDRMFTLATSTKPWIQFARLYFGPMMVRRIFRSPENRRRAFRFISQLGVRYRHSRIVVGAGERAPNVNGLHEKLRGPGHDLVVFGAMAPWQAMVEALQSEFKDKLAEPLRIHAVPNAAPYAKNSAYLIRPDGHIAAMCKTPNRTVFQKVLTF